MGVLFEVLGPLRVLDAAGDEVRIPAGRERALLSLLVIERGRVVSVDRILAALWGERPPGTAAKAVQGYVSHLRRLLAPADGGDGPIVTRAPGYALMVPDDAVDAGRFDALARDGRRRRETGDAEGAAAAFDAALGLVRGPVLADVAFEDFAQDEIRRREGLVLDVVEDRADALLAAGRTGGLAAELEPLVDGEPLRERLRSLAMVALYREGRQADALELYEAGRRALAAELGVDPGPELTGAHRAILVQDPALGPVRPTPAAPPPGAAEAPRPPARRFRFRLALAGAALAVVVVALIAWRAGDAGAPRPALGGPALLAIDPATNRVVASVAVGSRPLALVADDRGLWVGDARDGTVTLIDPASRRTVRVIGIGAPALDLAAGEGGVWVATGGLGEIVQLDPERLAVARRIMPGPSDAVIVPTVSSVEAGGGWVWAGTLGGLVRIDPATGRESARTDLGMASALHIAVDGQTVWATTIRRQASRVEAGSAQRTAEFYAGRVLLPVAIDDGAVWVGAADDAIVWKLDALTGATELTSRVGAGANAMAAGEEALWVSSWRDGSIARVDRATGETRAVVATGGRPEDIALAAGLVWVAVTAPEA